MATEFEARTAYNADVDIHNDPPSESWDISELSAESGSLFWLEDDVLFKLKTSSPSASHAHIVKLSAECRVAILDDEAWLLNDRSTKLHNFILGYLPHELGLLLWDFTDAIWVTTVSVWDPHRLAHDELSFSEITPEGIALGKGYNAPNKRNEVVKLDLVNRCTILKAYG